MPEIEKHIFGNKKKVPDKKLLPLGVKICTKFIGEDGAGRCVFLNKHSSLKTREKNRFGTHCKREPISKNFFCAIQKYIDKFHWLVSSMLHRLRALRPDSLAFPRKNEHEINNRECSHPLHIKINKYQAVLN